MLPTQHISYVYEIHNGSEVLFTVSTWDDVIVAIGDDKLSYCGPCSDA